MIRAIQRLTKRLQSDVGRHRFQRRAQRYGRVVGTFLAFIALMTLVFYIAEHSHEPAETTDPDPASLAEQLEGIRAQMEAAQTDLARLAEVVPAEEEGAGKTIWQILVYFFTGFGDYEPQTALGKFIAVIVFIVGIVLVATLTGRIASYFVAQDLEHKMPDELQDHIVICNWNDRGDRVVTELHSQQGVPDTEIVILAPKDLNEREYRSKPAYHKVTFINSDPSMHDVLRVCNAHRARAVVLIADETRYVEDPDGNSALIALAINRLSGNTGLPRPHIVAEALDHRRIQHLHDAGVDEVVCAHDFGLGILAQSSIHPGLTEVYNRLLTYSESTNEIYIIDEVPERFHGLDFAEAAKVFANNRDTDNPSILIGVKRDGEIFLNARQGHYGTKLGLIQPKDQLICIAFDLPDLARFNGKS